MKYYKGDMDERQFLNYVNEHSKTQRALFNKEMVAEIFHLTGDDETAKDIAEGIKSWYSIDLRDEVREIQLNKSY